MPSRWLTLTIIAFWVGTTSWMVYREIAPTWRAGLPPPFSIDLTDEVSGTAVQWNVLQKGKMVATGSSFVRRQADRTYKLHSEFAFTDFQLLGVPLRKMTSMYRVTAEGALRELMCTVKIAEFDIHVSGRVEDGYLVPEIELSGVTKWPGAKVAVPVNVLNPMHLLNRLAGVHEGQSWIIPLIDPTSANLPGQGLTEIPHVEATVRTGLLAWNGADVPCFKIEYRPLDKDQVVARTWVRQRDGLVLQQEAQFQGKELVLQRSPNK